MAGVTLGQVCMTANVLRGITTSRTLKGVNMVVLGLELELDAWASSPLILISFLWGVTEKEYLSQDH